MLKYYQDQLKPHIQFWGRDIINGIKISEDKRFITYPNNITVEFELPLEEKIPEYNSWDGFNKWIETISIRLGITKNQAYIQLLDPKTDLRWIEMYSDEETQDFVERITPFNCSNPLQILDVWFYKNYRNKKFSISSVFYDADIIQKYLPQTKRDLINIKKMLQFTIYCNDDNVISENIKKYNLLKLNKKSENELFSVAFLGVINNKFVKLLNKCDYMQNFTELSNAKQIINEIDDNYFNGQINFINLFRAGVKLQTLFSKYNLTKAQCIDALNLYGDSKKLTFQNIANIKGYELPDHWFRYINSSEVLDWANSKKDQLLKSREIHGPTGQSVTFYYHTLLEYITPDMLNQGPKTAWRKIMKELEEIQQKKIEDSLGEYVEFKIDPNITKVCKDIKEVKILKDNFSLRTEGNIMQHCVAGYVHSCITGKSTILHIEIENKSSTAEIGLKDNQYNVFQHKGIKNSNTYYKNNDLLDNIIKKLNSKRKEK